MRKKSLHFDNSNNNMYTWKTRQKNTMCFRFTIGILNVKLRGTSMLVKYRRSLGISKHQIHAWGKSVVSKIRLCLPIKVDDYKYV